MSRLKRSNPSANGFRSVRSGRGFGYRSASGEAVRDEETQARARAAVFRMLGTGSLCMGSEK